MHLCEKKSIVRAKQSLTLQLLEIRTYKDTVTAQVQTALNTLMYAQTGAKAPHHYTIFRKTTQLVKRGLDQLTNLGTAIQLD